jgi:hypothetical protein
VTPGRAFLAWFVLLAVGFSNGVFRQIAITPYLAEPLARQVSTVLAIVLLGAAMWLLTGRRRFRSAAHAWLTGLLWCALTVAFEFAMGRAGGHSWERLLSDYALWEGRLWALVPIWILTAPALFHRIRTGAPRTCAVPRE